MLRYAQIINEETKQCDVSEGTNVAYYESIGMSEMEVEQAYNGYWYIKGYAPQKPEEVIKQERIAELHKLLQDADYWGQKYLDGEYTEEEWAERVAIRRAWRKELRELEG